MPSLAYYAELEIQKRVAEGRMRKQDAKPYELRRLCHAVSYEPAAQFLYDSGFRGFEAAEKWRAMQGLDYAEQQAKNKAGDDMMAWAEGEGEV